MAMPRCSCARLFIAVLFVSVSAGTLPGDYLVRAVPQSTFDSWQAARRHAQKYTSGGVPVTVNAWGTTKVALTLQP